MTGDAQAWLDVSEDASSLMLRPQGDWVVRHAETLDKALSEIHSYDRRAATFDLSHLTRLDTAGAWLIYRTGRSLERAGAKVTYAGATAAQELAFTLADGLDYVRAARALGLSHAQIIWRHVLPNSLTPVVTFLPFRMSAAILALTSLDFLGLGVPPGTPSLGEMLAQGKTNIDAWWISMSTFALLVFTLLLLTFMGDALRNALDPRLADSEVQS